MKVALVHDYLTQFGGAERTLKTIAALYPRAPIFTIVAEPSIADAHFSGHKIITSFLQQYPFSRSKHRFFSPLMPYAIESLNFSRYDLVISSSATFAKGVITSPAALHINYCHTTLRYAWDDSPRYAEDFRSHPGFLRKLAPFFLHYLRVWDHSAAQRPDAFIVNSKFVARRVKKYYGRDAKVIYPPVSIPNRLANNTFPNNREYIRENSRGNSSLISDKIPYFLMVGRLVPYKRFDLAVATFNELGWPLKIAGDGPEKQRLRKIAKKNVEFLGYVSDDELAELYRSAEALIFPQEEDFGIVAVEAMAAGKPVIAYRGGGALETVREGETGIFFDEQTPASMTDALSRFRQSQFNSETIRTHAQQFSEERFKKEIQNFIAQQLNQQWP